MISIFMQTKQQAGTGIIFAVDDDETLVVDALLPGGPAARKTNPEVSPLLKPTPSLFRAPHSPTSPKCGSAQILPGDRLLSVDLFRVDRLNHHQIVRMVRGPAGTRVKLGFGRPSEPGVVRGSDLFFVTLDRAPPSQAHMPAFGSPRRGPRPPTGRTFFVL
jgi:hypothetical protein